MTLPSRGEEMNLNFLSPQKENLLLFPQVFLAFSKPPSRGSRGIGSPTTPLDALGALVQPAPSLQQAAQKLHVGGAWGAACSGGSGGSRTDCLSVATIVLPIQHLPFQGLVHALMQQTFETKEKLFQHYTLTGSCCKQILLVFHHRPWVTHATGHGKCASSLPQSQKPSLYSLTPTTQLNHGNTTLNVAELYI